jgi:predicted PhzF superfamily epimerase YddE/YHI9
VFEDGSSLGDDQMQRLALEMNFSETVFLPPAEHGGDARIRIFTPAAELPFAGHPVLGTAFVVGEARQLTSVQLETAAAAVAACCAARVEAPAGGDLVQHRPGRELDGSRRPVSRCRGVYITDRPDDPPTGSCHGNWKRPWKFDDWNRPHRPGA